MINKRADFRALVSGAGSIGRRHIRNLQTLGVHNVAAYDPDFERLKSVSAELGTHIHAHSSFEDALSTVEPDIVLICSPPVEHTSQALQAVHAGCHIFVEKPLSHSLNNVSELIGAVNSMRRVAQVGYNLRFNPGLQKVKLLLEEETIGRVLWATVEVGQYLPEWRPWQDYRYSYSARRNLGGSVILDASHEIDYALWLLGIPCQIACMAGKVSDLDIDVEDCATILLRFTNGAQADIHMDCIQRRYSRRCKIVGEKGTITWDYSKNQVQIYCAENKREELFSYVFDANDMYTAELEHFLDCVLHDHPPIVGLRQAGLVVQVALEAMEQAVSKEFAPKI